MIKINRILKLNYFTNLRVKCRWLFYFLEIAEMQLGRYDKLTDLTLKWCQPIKEILLFWTKFFSMLHYFHLTWKPNGSLMSPCMQPVNFYLIYKFFLLQTLQFSVNLLYIHFPLHMTQLKLWKTPERLRRLFFSSNQHLIWTRLVSVYKLNLYNLLD